VSKTTTPPTEVPPPLPLPKPDRRLTKALIGDWILVSYHLTEDGEFFEVPISSSKHSSPPERWHFQKDGTFRQIMSGALTFSGHWQVAKISLEPHWLDPLPKGKGLLLSRTKVRSNIPGIKRPEDHYWGVINGERLILYYLGQSQKPAKLPSQGHGLRKSWRGGWDW